MSVKPSFSYIEIFELLNDDMTWNEFKILSDVIKHDRKRYTLKELGYILKMIKDKYRTFNIC